VVSAEISLKDPPYWDDGPLVTTPSKNWCCDRFQSLPAPNLPAVPSRFASVPPISLIPTLATTATHLHGDSILSSFQTTCGPSAVPPYQEEEQKGEDGDDRVDADLIPPVAPPKLLRTPSATVHRTARATLTESEDGSSDMDIEEDLVAKSGWTGDHPTLEHISQPATPTEIKEETGDGQYYAQFQSPDNETGSELPQEGVERPLAARRALDGLDDDESESEVKSRANRNVTFCLPDTPKIRVRIKRQYRKKGDRVALSDLDPKRVWMKILDDPPEMDSEEEDSDDSLLLVQTL
ncbi:hypothetical protein M407DRAFT_16978, partial [Tulasnella calospora MUT 4182]